MNKKEYEQTNNNVTSDEIKKNLFISFKGLMRKWDLSIEEINQIFADETTKAINRDIDPEATIEFDLDLENEKVNIYNLNREVVENDFEFSDDQTEHISFITLEDALKIKDEAQVGDVIKSEINFDLLKEKSKTAIKNGLNQSLRSNLKIKTYEKYQPLIGKRFKARVLTKNNNGSYNLIFEDNTNAFLPVNKINKNSEITPGSTIDVYLESVELDTKLSQCQVSIDSPNAIVDLLTNEIPEISQGLIEVVDVQRIGGERTKVSVRATSNYDLDPVSSIIGVNGKRILAISDKLNGEKIDVIRYSENLADYIKYALSPAKVIDVVNVDEKYPNSFTAIIRNEEITTAIGKKGINVELAKSLTGTKIDIISPEEAAEKGIEFSKEKQFEKHLFNTHRSGSNHRRDKDYFFDLEIDMNEFKEDVSAFRERMNATDTDINFDSPKTTSRPKNNPKREKVDLDQLFNVEDTIEKLSTTEEDEYDFINDIDFDKVFDDSEAELEESLAFDDEAQNYKNNKKASKTSAAPRVAPRLNDFKVDEDLANYGLDQQIDLSEFEDEWEK